MGFSSRETAHEMHGRSREHVEKGEQDGKTPLEAMQNGDTQGMHHFDGEIEKLVRAGIVNIDSGLAYARNPGTLRLTLSGSDHATLITGKSDMAFNAVFVSRASCLP